MDFTASLYSRTRFILFLLITLVGCEPNTNQAGSQTLIPTNSDFSLAAIQSFSRSSISKAVKNNISQISDLGTAIGITNIQNSQKAVQSLYLAEYNELPRFIVDHVQTTPDNKIDYTRDCRYGGTVTYYGEIDERLLNPKILATFNKCTEEKSRLEYGDHQVTLDGEILLVEEHESNGTYVSQYFNELSIKNDSRNLTITGLTVLEKRDNGQFTKEQHLFIDNHNLNEQVELIRTHDTASVVSGSVNHSTIGQWWFETNYVIFDFSLDQSNQNRFIKLTASKDALLEFFMPLYHVRYLEDSNSDESFDQGTYFSTIWELFYRPSDTKQLVQLSEMSLPPDDEMPVLNARDESIFFNTPIEVTLPHLFDPDNTTDELSYQFYWLINGQPISDISTNILPANMAYHGDKVNVYAIISDGVNSIRTGEQTILINNTPPRARILNKPESIRIGDEVNLMVELFDPDHPETPNTDIQLIAGPLGATMSAEGELSWIVGSILPLPQQEITFTLASLDGANDEVELGIAIDSDNPLPMTFSHSPHSTKHSYFLVDDFDGDGLDEILTTDAFSSLVLMDFDGSRYVQKWAYPFKMPSEGHIVRLQSVNLDDDIAKELIVTTSFGMSIIDNLESVARLKLVSPNKLHQSLVVDFDFDHNFELARVEEKPSIYQTRPTEFEIYVTDWDVPRDPYFSVTTDISRYSTNPLKQLDAFNVFGNDNLELILDYPMEIFTENIYTTPGYFQTVKSEVLAIDDEGNLGFLSTDKDSLVLKMYLPHNLQTVFAQNSYPNKGNFLTFNFDDDSVREIAYQTQFDIYFNNEYYNELKIFDFTNQQFVELGSVYLPRRPRHLLHIGDTNNDSINELHYYDHYLSVLAATPIENFGVITTTTYAEKYTEVKPLGWRYDGQDYTPSFLAHKTVDPNIQPSLISMHANQPVHMANLSTPNFGSEHADAILGDYNRDGITELLYRDIRNNNTPLEIKYLDESLASYTQFSGRYSATNFKNIPISEDSVGPEGNNVVFIDEKALVIFDAAKGETLHELKIDNNINDYIVVNTTRIILKTWNNTILVKFDENMITSKEILDLTCDFFVEINFDDDDDKELACVKSRSISILDLENDVITERFRKSYKFDIHNLIADVRTESNQGFIATISPQLEYEDHSYASSFTLALFSHQGYKVASSPRFSSATYPGGMIAKLINGKLEILLSSIDYSSWLK